MQAATRMAEGQWPWRDFAWSYGPGQPLAVALAAVRAVAAVVAASCASAADATAAVLVYALVRDVRPRWALPAWARRGGHAAQPTSANPTAPALAFALAAVLCATRAAPGVGGSGRGARRVLAPGRGRDRRAGRGGRVRGGRAARPRDERGDARRGAATRRVARTASAGRQTRGGDAAPGGDGRGRRRARPSARVLVVLGVAALGGLVLYAPFLVAAGPGRVWDALVVQGTPRRGVVAVAVPRRVRAGAT